MAFTFESPEDFTQFLTGTEEGKAIFKQLTADYIKPENIEGLVKNRDLIKKEKQQLKADYDAIVNKMKIQEEKFVNFDPEEYIKLKEEKENSLLNSQSEENNSDTEKQINDLKVLLSTKERSFTQQKEKILKDSEGIVGQLTAITNKYNDALIKNALASNFDEVGVAEEHRSILKAAFHGRAVIEVDEDGNHNILMRSEEGRLPIKDFFNSWAESKESKYYIKAPLNKGGGGNGSSNAYKGKDLQAEYRKAALEGRTQDAIAIQNIIRSQANQR